uniref:Uncharacterized protein n=1 Tax=Arundo donax TaxID=35708 RepID=A0A0A9BRF0_ARUDO
MVHAQLSPWVWCYACITFDKLRVQVKLHF